MDPHRWPETDEADDPLRRTEEPRAPENLWLIMMFASIVVLGLSIA